MDTNFYALILWLYLFLCAKTTTKIVVKFDTYYWYKENTWSIKIHDNEKSLLKSVLMFDCPDNAHLQIRYLMCCTNVRQCSNTISRNNRGREDYPKQSCMGRSCWLFAKFTSASPSSNIKQLLTVKKWTEFWKHLVVVCGMFWKVGFSNGY